MNTPWQPIAQGELLAEIDYERGPQMIRSEGTFLTAGITFGGVVGMPEVDVVVGLRRLGQKIRAKD